MLSRVLIVPLLLLATACATAGATATATAEVVDADTAVEMLTERDELTVIDVRTPAEHAAGHLAGTQLIDIQSSDFTARIGELDRDGAYLIYCRTGNRSAAAVQAMVELGFTELYDAGGFAELAAAGARTGP